MTIQIYILGFLMRFGPMHGYKLKQMIFRQVADFAQIKLFTIYYHLDKMEKKGFVKAEIEQEGRRPERAIYTVTESGKHEFVMLLKDAMLYKYSATSPVDAVFYFGDSVSNDELIAMLKENEIDVKNVIDFAQEQSKHILKSIPDSMKTLVQVLFNHHLLHYKAELEWIKNTMKDLSNSSD